MLSTMKHWRQWLIKFIKDYVHQAKITGEIAKMILNYLLFYMSCSNLKLKEGQMHTSIEKWKCSIIISSGRNEALKSWNNLVLWRYCSRLSQLIVGGDG